MHHDCIHAVGHGERLEVGLDGHREGQLVDEVHRCAGNDRAAAQILEAEDCRTRLREKCIWVLLNNAVLFCLVPKKTEIQ